MLQAALATSRRRRYGTATHTRYVRKASGTCYMAGPRGQRRCTCHPAWGSEWAKGLAPSTWFCRCDASGLCRLHWAAAEDQQASESVGCL